MKNDNNIPKPTLTIKHGRISIGVQPEKEYILTPDEETAISYIIDILKNNRIDTSVIHTEHTANYLKIVANDYHCFCNLKLKGKSYYIELAISSTDQKNLIDDPRFIDFNFTKKRFTHIPISNVHDILNYKDLIIAAFNFY